MVITNSPDLGVLEVQVEFDLTGATPVINLTNQTIANPNVSPIPDLSTLEWVLNIFSPTGTPILQSDFNSPWKTGVWTTEQLTNAWPNPFNQIEWSGADYLVLFQVRDSAGNIYELNKEGSLKRPVGNTPKTASTFGAVSLSVEVLCDSANLYLKDNTSKSYQGITGILQSSYLAIDYPRDSTGVRPDPFVITSFTTDAIIPFTFNAKGYEATYYSTYRYDLGDNVFVVIRYTAQICFDVLCNVDLCPLACEVKSLEESIESGRCADVQAAQAALNLIIPKLLRAFIAKANPTCGIDLPKLIDEIKAIGNFSCDCYGASTGISTSARTNDYVFSVNNQGGDIIGSFQQTGGNVVLTIKDKSYTFGPSTGSVTLKATTSGTNTDVQLDVNINNLATDIYNATANNATLLNLFNSLVINGGFTLLVDGKCVINTGSCDYIWTLSNVKDLQDTFLKGIQVNGSYQNLSFSFNINTLPALQAYLNSLGVGTFVVADIGGEKITITTTGNSFSLGNIAYVPFGMTRTTASFTQDCSGILTYTPDEVVQAIIDYLCNLTDSQVRTSVDYTICYVSPSTKAKDEVIVPAGTLLTDFFTELLARDCDTIEFVSGISSLVNCQVIKANFPTSIKVMQENDVLYGTKEQECAPIYPVEFGIKMLQYGYNNADFRAAFCALVAACAGGGICEPYSVFNLSTVENSPYDNKLDIIVTFTHPSAVSNSIRYARLDVAGPLVWSVPAIVLPGASPYTIANVNDGQYVVGITPIYSDGRTCTEVTATTGSCGAMNAFSAAFDGSDIIISYNAPVGVPKVRVVISYPNGGVFSQIYTNAGTDITITPPVGLYGSYTITMQTVCNESTSWFGPVTAPAIVVVPNPSIIYNNSTFDVVGAYYGQYILTSTDTTGPIFLTASGLAQGASKVFSIPDGFYYKVLFFGPVGTFFPITGKTASLNTGTGVYVGTLLLGAGVNIISFENVQVLNGMVVTVIDSSP